VANSPGMLCMLNNKNVINKNIKIILSSIINIMYDNNVIYFLYVFIFIVTFTDSKLYDSYYRCETQVIPRPLAAVLTTQGMLMRLRFVNGFCNIIYVYEYMTIIVLRFVLLFVMLFFNIV